MILLNIVNELLSCPCSMKCAAHSLNIPDKVCPRTLSLPKSMANLQAVCIDLCCAHAQIVSVNWLIVNKENGATPMQNGYGNK